MKNQLNSVSEVNLKPELIQIDYYGVVFGIFCHFLIPSNLIEKTGDFAKTENQGKKSDGNYHEKPYHMPKMASIYKRKKNGALKSGPFRPVRKGGDAPRANRIRKEVDSY